MAEEIIISIELEKGDNEKQVDVLTQKITGLTKANADLNKQNKELVKTGQENSKEYIENTRQIEINKQKINESQASRKNLIQTILAEDDSIKGLKVRNAELIKQRDQLSTKTVEGREKISQINSELDRNNQTILENSSALEKQKFNIGNYKSALDGIVPGLGGFITGIQGATKAGLAFIATPIGLVLAAVGAALFALTSYFKGSEEGQNKLNKIMAVGSAIMEQFMNVVEAVGGALFAAFENPKKAVGDLAKLIKENIQNRFEGLLELIPQLGRAIGLLFEGKFGEAGKVAADATIKVVTGIENATDKIAGFIEETGRLVEQGIENGQRLADMQARIDRDERALIVERAKSTLEVSKLREDAITQEGELKKKTIEEAISLEQKLTDKEVEFAKIKLEQAKLLRDANGDDKEALKAVAEAQAAVFNAESTAFANTLKFRKQLAALNEEEAKLKTQQAEDQKKAEEEQFQNNIKIIEDGNVFRLEAIKGQYLNELISKEEFEAQFSFIELSALEERKAFFIANGEDIAAIDQQILDLRIKQKEAADAKDLASSKKLSDEKIRQKRQEARGIEESINAGVDLAKEAFGENKAIAIAETVINTVRGMVRAIADYPFPYSAIISAAVGTLGTIQTAKLAGIGFAGGGRVLSGERINSGHGSPIRRSNGDNLLATVRTGEVILNERQQAALGGARTFRSIGVPGFAGGGSSSFAGQNATNIASQQAMSSSAMRDLTLAILARPAVVTVEDINAKQDEVYTTQQRAQVI